MEVLSKNLPRGLRKTTKNLSKDSNQGPPECESRALPLHQPVRCYSWHNRPMNICTEGEQVGDCKKQERKEGNKE
jgi:hypothetical protein